jgi:hypothetical protein
MCVSNLMQPEDDTIDEKVKIVHVTATMCFKISIGNIPE